MAHHLKDLLSSGRRILKPLLMAAFFLVGIVGIIVLLIRVLRKDSIQNLVTPGNLTVMHAKYENDCARCHRAFRKESQNDLCLVCHKEVSEDLINQQGLHGKSGIVKGKQCKSCHTDHKGRDFDITHLDRGTFNHDLTDFALVGVHARASITCEACHLQGKKFKAAPKDCLSCHLGNDAHRGQLGKDCARCHKENSWKDTFFEHNKTRFPLEGKHQKVTCNVCHANKTYKNTPIDCNDCHLLNDIHALPREEHCSQCHSVESWKQISYDHNQKTKFILEGRHAQAKCDLCHLRNLFNPVREISGLKLKDERAFPQGSTKNKVGVACVDCHKVDDVHKSKNGLKCESCHTPVDWKQISFEHNRDTQYKLSGRHNGLKCAVCHRDNSGKMKIDVSCYSCHKQDDSHKGQQGTKCELCHNENGWREDAKFDHDLTSFPLIGLHAVTLCGECHLSTTFKDADKACFSCHKLDDYHKGSLGADCAKCHNPNGWKLWEFEHNTQTTYKLEGAHEGLECNSCHQKLGNNSVKVSSVCSSCHEDDDVHRGNFGQLCDRCHTVESFKRLLWEDK